MSLFKSYSDVTEKDKQFTATVNAIRESVEDSFVKYESELAPGLYTNEVDDFVLPFGDLYESNDEDLHWIIPASKEFALSFAKWLANFDLVVLEGKECNVSRSNHKDTAILLTRLFRIAE